MKGKNESTPFLPLKSETGGKSDVHTEQGKYVSDGETSRTGLRNYRKR